MLNYRTAAKTAVPLLAIATASGIWAAPASAATQALPANCVSTASVVTCSYFSTGAEQTFTVPAGVQALQITAVGGHGGNSVAFGGDPLAAGGAAASATTRLGVVSGRVLYVEVGGNGAANDTNSIYPGVGGWNGGATGGFGTTDGDNFNLGGSGGGGATDVRRQSLDAPQTLASRVLVAAGGGGASTEAGGAAGQAGTGYEGDTGGQPGTATSGGAGGPGPGGFGNKRGFDGTAGRGGPGCNMKRGLPTFDLDEEGGGGGAGGLYGGGGGGLGAGGGGGSSYAPGGTTGLAADNAASSVVITYRLPVT